MAAEAERGASSSRPCACGGGRGRPPGGEALRPEEGHPLGPVVVILLLLENPTGIGRGRARRRGDRNLDQGQVERCGEIEIEDFQEERKRLEHSCRERPRGGGAASVAPPEMSMAGAPAAIRNALGNSYDSSALLDFIDEELDCDDGPGDGKSEGAFPASSGEEDDGGGVLELRRQRQRLGSQEGNGDGDGDARGLIEAAAAMAALGRAFPAAGTGMMMGGMLMRAMGGAASKTASSHASVVGFDLDVSSSDSLNYGAPSTPSGRVRASSHPPHSPVPPTTAAPSR